MKRGARRPSRGSGFGAAPFGGRAPAPRGAILWHSVPHCPGARAGRGPAALRACRLRPGGTRGRHPPRGARSASGLGPREFPARDPLAEPRGGGALGVSAASCSTAPDPAAEPARDTSSGAFVRGGIPSRRLWPGCRPGGGRAPPRNRGPAQAGRAGASRRRPRAPAEPGPGTGRTGGRIPEAAARPRGTGAVPGQVDQEYDGGILARGLRHRRARKRRGGKRAGRQASAAASRRAIPPGPLSRPGKAAVIRSAC